MVEWWSSIRTPPFRNTLTPDFAKAAVTGYNLGNGVATDFLTVNCASTDYVGHQYGPNSIEVEDTYLRLDKDLAAFFRFLDEKVGKGNYLLFLTADHGAAHAIGFMKEHHIPADFIVSKKIGEPLDQFLKDKFGVENLVASSINYHFGFDLKRISQNKLDYEAVKKATVSFFCKNNREFSSQLILNILERRRYRSQ